MAAYTVEWGGGGGGSKPPSGPDMMISYHDNQHYNSVRSSARPKPPPPPPIPPNLRPQLSADPQPDRGTTSVLDTSGGVETVQEFGREDMPPEEEKKEPNDDYKARYGDHEDGHQREDDAPGGPAQRVRKNAPCPCGSGLRYKKCCHAKRKHAARLERMVRGGDVGPGGHDRYDDDEGAGDDLSMDGDFRVLKI